MQSRQGEAMGDKDQQRQMITIAPVAPDKETPNPGGEADAELAVILKQLKTYFNKQANSYDLEALSFSLLHLFNRVDFLYRQALPSLDRWTVRKQGKRDRELLQRQQIWLQLQAINRTLDRMTPLCHLLSDVIECLLDTLENEEVWLRAFDEEKTLQLEQVKSAGKHRDKQKGPESIESGHWERAVTALMDRLLIWQEQHHKLTPFKQQFAQPIPLECGLNELDTAFAVLLDSAGAIYGDILPNFRLFRPEDREEISALLFDLMQQSDQMLVQFEFILEPMARLIRHFGAVSESD